MKLKVVIIEKDGDLRDAGIREWNLETICRKLGFPNTNDFVSLAKWTLPEKDHIVYEIYGKMQGRSTHRSVYRFPTPFETLQLFGNALLIKRNQNNEILPLKAEEWQAFLAECHPESLTYAVRSNDAVKRPKRKKFISNEQKTNPFEYEYGKECEKDMEEEAYI